LPIARVDTLVVSLPLIKCLLIKFATIMTEDFPVLYVVPTPIGNLGDMTQRAIDVLRAVPWVAAEDTRHSAPLLKHYGSTARLLAAHEHNEEAAAEQIIGRLADGQSVAFVSDAGTPAVSDPGARLVARVRSAGYRVVPLPGACAAVTALSASGLTDAHFLFYGFLPAKPKQRQDALREIAALPYALVFYEAPHRILETVAALAEVLGGERTLVMARELSKIFETIHSCPLAAAHDWLTADGNRQRGEFVLLVSAAPVAADDGDGERVLRLLLAEGLPVKQAAKLAQSITGAGRNALYDLALTIKQAESAT
jgi:16S rRNA (cytidine1402-2'-O)-methyltransferase